MNYLLRYLLVMAFIFIGVLASDCNTVKGLGEDFEAVGRSMQKAGD